MLTPAEHARLNSYMVEIAVEVRGRAIPDNAGRYRFGSPGGSLCVYANLQFHDFNGGVHGFSAFELIKHLHPARIRSPGRAIGSRGILATVLLLPEKATKTTISPRSRRRPISRASSKAPHRRLRVPPVIVSSPAPKSAACLCTPRIKLSCAGSPISVAKKAR
jgi:hypothetical protein